MMSVKGVTAIVVALCFVVVCNGGKTSSFVRKTGASVDMPIDSDVFKTPSGYNAPQQVHVHKILNNLSNI